ncbi:MAG: DegT/DnrJ/EryC1/StrS family aminotransferase [Pseudomonadota bacterium]
MIPIIKPMMDEREAEAARRVILSGWITQGPEVAAFEKEFAAYTGAEHGVAVSNCTTALHLALLALGIKPGDEVITVSHSFIATANVIAYTGATPVFIDVDPVTFNLDPARIEAAITPKTRAILCVHQMGMPCDLAAIVKLARARGLYVIEDAACAIGAEIRWNGRWEKIGKVHGDIACFSFHPRKVMSTGDGGMITTPNKEWADKCRLLRQHGMSVPDTVRHGSAKVIFESYPVVGYNFRMTDIQAAVGREQLKRLGDIVQGRRAIAAQYRQLMKDIPGITLPQEPEWARSNWQSFCVRLSANLDQRAVMQQMLDAGVSTRRGIMCSHREEPYRDARRTGTLEHSEAAQDHCIVLPLYGQMTTADIRRVADELRAACSLSAGARAAVSA